MQLLDNKVMGRVGDKLKEDMKTGSKLSIISAYFTIYAYEALKKELEKIDKLRLLFSEPTFVQEKKNIKREFHMNISNERGLSGDKYELKLKGELKQTEIAKECAQWIKEKVEMKAFDATYTYPQKMFFIENKESNSVIYGQADFTSQGLGFVPSEKPFVETYVKEEKNQSSITKMMLQQFENLWNDKDKVKDVKKEVLERLEGVYKENTPQYIYFITLYNVFKDYLEDLDEEKIVKSRTGFKDTIVWNKLYKFQKDGVLGAIDKIEKYNGCIIADSVGLGKTFEALAIIKYYELRNHRVLVLAPKKLRENWSIYTQNDKRNLLANDRFNFDVLNHTDLSRYTGYSGEINLETINWENYDLIVIDESHNFRNHNTKEDKETRYTRLLNKVIKKGVKTKILMLSATPVNNKMNDLKNQIAFITEGKDSVFIEDGVKSVEQTMRKAQMAFNKWNGFVSEEKTVEKLLEMLEMDYFKLLDMLTIARSRKHIEKYYNMGEIGKFSTRLKPLNIYSDIDLNKEFPELKIINNQIRRLELSVYTPMAYLKPNKVREYEAKYDKKVNSSVVFKQSDREKSLINLMRINMLKRMESSINSFGMTTSKILGIIDNVINKIDNQTFREVDELDIKDIEVDDQVYEDMLIGSKTIKILIQDMDVLRWRESLERDRKILENLIIEAGKINSKRDAKLQSLKDKIIEKVNNPINPNNKKVIVFTAFADTAEYLYDNINIWAKETLGINSALITGSGTNKTTLKGIKTELNTLLTNFSPISKEREKISPEIKEEIDVLIATDCISEGQNLQDCDYLVNYDIHWNPVRIIQRFGRVDRLGSKNDKIQLVNFWPNVELDEYINLEARVSGRMVLLDINATGEENVIEQSEEDSMKDLSYRKNQLKQLQEQVVDLEDLKAGISITDFTFNDFKMDLMEFMKTNRDKLEKASSGMYAITEVKSEEMEKGVIFCLKKNEEESSNGNNPLINYYLVYVKDNGKILHTYTQSKQTLDIYRNLCSGNDRLFPSLIENFNKETDRACNMRNYSDKLEKVVESIVGKVEEAGISSLFKIGGTTLKKDSVKGIEDFELISFLIIK